MLESTMVAHNLPPQLTPFVGRDGELAEIARLLADPACRLLTLVGPGGIGKTRLAIEAARMVLDSPLRVRGGDGGGVCFVPLQPLSSPDFIVSTIADALGFHFYQGSDPERQLLDFLRDKSALLVLDNLEHLLDGVNLLSEILACAPDVSILATSRERLNLLEEWALNVEGLTCPASEAETDIGDYSAVQLFLQNAQRVKVGFTLTDAQKSAVTRICKLVGGMPLAIELAAAWVRALSCEQLARELEHSLDILETPARNVEPRHRNMRAAFEPTWNRLSEEEQRVYRQLAVFRGGFTREAAEYVAGATLRVLSALVDKSLLRVDANGRYEVHELLRQFGEEQLDTLPDEGYQTHTLHCAYFAEFLRQRWEHLKGKRQKKALTEIGAETDNIRRGWLWGVRQRKEVEISKAVNSLWFFYDTRGWYQEGEQVFRLAVEALSVNKVDGGQSVLLGRLLGRQGGFCFSLNVPESARNLLHESLAILRGQDDRREIGFALLRLGEVAMFLEDDPGGAKSYLQESLTLFRELGDQWGMAYALRWLSFVALSLGHYQEARRLVQESMAVYRESADEYGTAIALIVLGLSSLELGEGEEAKRAGQESLALCREIGLQWAVQNALVLMGAATCALGEYGQAQQYLYQAVSKANEMQLLPETLWALVETANLLHRIQRKERALEILAFSLHSSIPPVLGKQSAMRLCARLQDELPSDLFTAALARGRAHDLETTVLEAMAQLSQTGKDTISLTTASSGLNPLTARELEILQQVAGGLSNREIADRLFLAVNTVKYYNYQIFSKLYVANRTQAVARARELGLLT